MIKTNPKNLGHTYEDIFRVCYPYLDSKHNGLAINTDIAYDILEIHCSTHMGSDFNGMLDKMSYADQISNYQLAFKN